MKMTRLYDMQFDRNIWGCTVSGGLGKGLSQIRTLWCDRKVGRNGTYRTV